MSDLKLNKKNVFNKISQKEMNSDVFKAVELISHDPKNFRIYGSYAFAAQPYPADIDGFELINLCDNCDYNEALVSGAYITREIIKKIVNSPDAYLGDVKFCTDTAVLKGLDERRKNKKYDEQITVEDFNKIIDDLIKNKYITISEYDELKKLNTGKSNDKDALYEFFRNKGLLRWKGEELLKGYKQLSGNRIITLVDALRQCASMVYGRSGEQELSLALVKIDLWVKINGKFIEVTNVLMFSYTKTGSNKKIYFTYERTVIEKIMEGLKEEVASYYFNSLKKFFNPIKYAKRVFSLASIYQDRITGEKLVKLWRSPYNIFYSLRSEIGTLTDIITNIKNPPLKDIVKQIEDMKLRLVRIVDIDVPDNLYNDINSIVDDKIMSKTLILKKLNDMKETIKSIIDAPVLKYLKSVKLWPAPKKYLDEEYSVRRY
jgi:hypothetical protein